MLLLIYCFLNSLSLRLSFILEPVAIGEFGGVFLVVFFFLFPLLMSKKFLALQLESVISQYTEVSFVSLNT